MQSVEHKQMDNKKIPIYIYGSNTAYFILNVLKEEIVFNYAIGEDEAQIGKCISNKV